jgi:hypothetical protein
MAFDDDIPDDTGEFRRDLLGEIRDQKDLRRRVGTLETKIDAVLADVKLAKTLLLGDPDVDELRDGDRGGLVDQFREIRKLVPAVRTLVILVALRLAADMPVIFKTLLTLFK